MSAPSPLDLARWIANNPHLGPSAKAVATQIALHHAPEGCWPSTGRLAALTGLSRRTVMRALDELEALEVLHRVHKDGGTMRQASAIRPNRYRLRAPGVVIPELPSGPEGDTVKP